jgi:mono/diheme cytochrome c family protein
VTKTLLSCAAGALALAAFLPGEGAAQAPSRSTWDGVYSAEQAARGGDLYMNTCAQCHGPRMGGIDAAPALTGGGFASNWNGVALGDMVERIRVSMPQNAPGSLSRQQVADVLAYMLRENGFPPGEKALPRQTAFLQMIAYEAYRQGGR